MEGTYGLHMGREAGSTQASGSLRTPGMGKDGGGRMMGILGGSFTIGRSNAEDRSFRLYRHRLDQIYDDALKHHTDSDGNVDWQKAEAEYKWESGIFGMEQAGKSRAYSAENFGLDSIWGNLKGNLNIDE